MTIEKPETDIKSYMKMRDVCDYLSVTNKTICKWIRLERMLAHKIGKQWLFNLRKIDAWVSSHNEKGSKTRQRTGARNMGGSGK